MTVRRCSGRDARGWCPIIGEVTGRRPGRGRGHDNRTARTVAIGRGEAINAPALSAMFRQIIANNRAGGWRKLKRDG
jgi:hypothetical protein